MKIRVFIADDHQMFREALGSLLGSADDLEMVGETGNGLEVADKVNALRADLVCMDINMPGMNGIETTRRLRQNNPIVKVVALSAYADRRYVIEMLNAGANGYVTKAEASDELLRAIRAVAMGRTYLCPDVAGVLADTGLPTSPTIQHAPLSHREKQVAELVAKGLTSMQIAQALFIATSTVEVHRRNLMRKLGLRNAAALTRYMMSHDLLQN
jgi:two-component system NarL family response regulator